MSKRDNNNHGDKSLKMCDRDYSKYEELERLAERYKAGRSYSAPIHLAQESFDDKIDEVRRKKLYDDLIGGVPRRRQAPTVKVEKKSSIKKKHLQIKEKLTNVIGVSGVLLFFGAIKLVLSSLPFVMIGGNFFVSLLLIGINYLVPITSPIFWIWGLVCAISGVQDIWAIIYYIVFIVVWIPFYISIITSILKK